MQVEAKLLAKLGTMSAHEMCVILWAFAKTGHKCPEGFRKAVPWILSRQDPLIGLAHRVQKFTDVGNILWRQASVANGVKSHTSSP